MLLTLLAGLLFVLVQIGLAHLTPERPVWVTGLAIGAGCAVLTRVAWTLATTPF
jgi:hypothetical protein